MLIAGLFDTLDGALARATNRVTVFGTFYDSTMDRFSEAVIFLGIAVGFVRGPVVGVAEVAGVALTFVVMIGSLMISYARARAEGLQPRVDCEVGLLQRPERILILGVGLLLPQGWLLGVLAVLAVLTHVTVGQRIAHVRRMTSAAVATS